MVIKIISWLMNQSEGSPLKEKKKATNKYFFLSGVWSLLLPTFDSQTNAVLQFTYNNYCMLPGNGLIEGQVFKPSVDYKFLKIRNLDHTLQIAFTTTKTIDVNWLVQWIKRDTYITNCSNVPLLSFVQHNYIFLIFSYITNYKLWEK